MENSKIQKIIFDYFDGKTTSLQRKWLEDWLKENADNEVLFYQYLDEWENQNPQYTPNEEHAWKRFAAILHTSNTSIMQLAEVENSAEPLNINNRRRFWLMAASIALLITASLFLFQKSIFYRTYQTAYGETQSITLSDGTQVVLNAHSTLEVPRWGFRGKKRTVLLEGEGAFDVTHTVDNQHFIIKTNSDFEVEVFGTQFVFYAREQAKKVVLNEGKVQINYQAGKQQVMKPGDIATLDAQTNILKLTKTDKPETYSAWKNHQFYFDNTTLSEASLMIKEHFGLELILKDTILGNRPISGYFKAEKPEELFNALSVLLNIDIQKKNNTFIISSKQ
jgi:transmembrane sensor